MLNMTNPERKYCYGSRTGNQGFHLSFFNLFATTDFFNLWIYRKRERGGINSGGRGGQIVSKEGDVVE